MESLITILVYGLIGALNFIFILIKLNQVGHKIDALVDFIIFATVIVVFSQSTEALKIGVVCSFISSIYLWFCPPKFLRSWL